MKEKIVISSIITLQDGTEKFAQAIVLPDKFIGVQEDLGNPNRCYILFEGGNFIHADLSMDDFVKIAF